MRVGQRESWGAGGCLVCLVWPALFAWLVSSRHHAAAGSGQRGPGRVRASKGRGPFDGVMDHGEEKGEGGQRLGSEGRLRQWLRRGTKRRDYYGLVRTRREEWRDWQVGRTWIMMGCT